MRIELIITEGESNWYFNKFSHYLCWKKMYREKKWEFYFWYYFVSEVKKAIFIFHLPAGR